MSVLVYKLKSEILADLGQKKEAIKYGELSLLIAKKVDDQYYIKETTKNIEKWKNE